MGFFSVPYCRADGLRGPCHLYPTLVSQSTLLASADTQANQDHALTEHPKPFCSPTTCHRWKCHAQPHTVVTVAHWCPECIHM